MTDAKILAEETAKEVDPAARAFKTEQDSSPLIKANAEKSPTEKPKRFYPKPGSVFP